MNSRNGDYSQKSGYWFNMEREEVEAKTLPFWKKFWNLKFWPKWKIFYYWKLANGALATTVNLRNRNILSEAPCPLRGLHEESVTHLLKDCEITREFGLVIPRIFRHLLRLFKKINLSSKLISNYFKITLEGNIV